jgi:hypothetical protein
MTTMLCRSTRLHHPLGITLETPLLVPSFSSKGLGFDTEGKSEIKQIFAVVSEYLTDTMLVSAYDIAYEHLQPIGSAITELTIVDSGGYEVSDLHDLSAVYRQPVQPKEWTMELLRQIYNSWPKHIPAVFVSYDHPNVRQSLSEQIDAAQSLFSHYPRQLHTLLIKPETKDQQYVQINNVIASARELRGFNILGLTEKELGNSILDRMKNIAAIRIAMDDAGTNIPIHIFGSLDPITSVLYFLAGAEMFDGLTWLRYGYGDGIASYQHNYGALRIGIDRQDGFLVAKTMQENLGYLLDLTHQMQKYVLDGDFAQLKPHSDFFRASYDLLRTKNKRIK